MASKSFSENWDSGSVFERDGFPFLERVKTRSGPRMRLMSEVRSLIFLAQSGQKQKGSKWSTFSQNLAPPRS